MPKISQIDEVPCQAEVRILQKITLNTVTGDETGRTSLQLIDSCINPFITHPAHERLYHTTGVDAPYSLRTAVWVLLRPTRIRTVKEL